MTETITLDAADLLSKFGFDDGDMPNELGDRFECTDDLDEFGPALDVWHDVLSTLVEQRIVPAVVAPGHTVETYRLDTIHNPIQASRFDGAVIDGYGGRNGGDPNPVDWDEIVVTVPLDECERLVREAMREAAK